MKLFGHREALSRGFGLVELITAIAIVGILISLAVPFYQDYTTRARVSEALEMADGARVRVDVDMATMASLPPTDLLDSGGKPVDRVTALTWTPRSNGGYILAAMDLPRFGQRNVFALELRSDGNHLEWHCVNAAKVGASNPLEDKYLPTSCRGDGSMVAKSSLPQPSSSSGVIASLAPASPAPASPAPASPAPASPAPASATPPAVAGSAASGQIVVTDIPDATTCPPGQLFRLDASHSQSVVDFAGDPLAWKGQIDWTPGQALTGQCVDRNPSPQAIDPYKSRQCHVCAGPPAICEMYHREQTCTWPNNFCGVYLANRQDQSRDYIRSCVPFQAAVDSYNKYSATESCTEFNIGHVYTKDFTCLFACTEDNCNLGGSNAGKPQTILGGSIYKGTVVSYDYYEYLSPYAQ